jgi:hypothetical protein
MTPTDAPDYFYRACVVFLLSAIAHLLTIGAVAQVALFGSEVSSAVVQVVYVATIAGMALVAPGYLLLSLTRRP